MFRIDLRPQTLGPLAVALLLAGCNGNAVDTADAPGPQPPGWLSGLPERAVEAAQGETVWAVVPELGSEAARLGSYRLEAAVGTGAVLTDDIGNRYEGVPGVLVHALSSFPEAELAPGSMVLAGRWDVSRVVGRITSVDEGKIELAYDWNGVTVTSGMDAVMAVPAGEDSLVLRWVGYPGEDGAWYKGLCFAESDDQVWLNTDDGHVVVTDRSAVKPLADLGSPLAAGDAVAAYTWAHGFRSGVIEEVLEPGLRYAVKLESGETRPIFFDSLTAEPL